MATRDSRHPDAVDATRFDGQQEGHRHEWLKRGLTAMLEADPAFDTVAQERVVLHDGQRRRPDVQAVGPDGPVSFEVQLATPQLLTLLARAAFYAAAGYRLVWIVDGGAGNDLLLRQGFQDILWMQGGQILALDDGCLADAGRIGRAQVLHVGIRETATDFEFANNRVSLAEAIDKICPANGDMRPLVASDPAARAVFAAMRSGSQRDVQAALDTLLRSLNVPLSGVDALEAGLPAALCALGTLLTGRKHDASNFKEVGNAHAILNVFLNTPRHRVWAQLLPMARGLSSEADLNLRHGSTALKLAAALGSLGVATIPSDPIPLWAPVIARLFPRLAPALGAVLPR